MAIAFNCSFARCAVKKFSAELGKDNKVKLTAADKTQRFRQFNDLFTFTVDEIAANRTSIERSKSSREDITPNIFCLLHPLVQSRI